MELMKKIVREQNQTLVMVTHDNHLASFADRIFHKMCIRDRQKIQPRVPSVPSRFGQVHPPFSVSLYSFSPNRSRRSSFKERKRLSVKNVFSFVMSVIFKDNYRWKAKTCQESQKARKMGGV